MVYFITITTAARRDTVTARPRAHSVLFKVATPEDKQDGASAPPGSRMSLRMASRMGCSLGVAQHDDDAVAAQEHLADESVLVHGLGLLGGGALGRLRPHLLDVLEDHVTVAVEGLDAAEQLLVVSAVDQHLRVALHALREHGQRARRELLLLGLRLIILATGVLFSIPLNITVHETAGIYCLGISAIGVLV